MPRRLLLLIGLALALPAPASAADATIVSRDVPLGAQRSLTAGKPAGKFNLVGLHWRGSGTVQFRTRSLSGRWSGWLDAAPEAEDQPDVGTDERTRLASWRLGNPWWVGPSDRIEYRLRGRVTRLRAYFVWSPPAGVPARALQKAGSPAIIPRSGWNADETIRRSTPNFASVIRLALVHHTAGANGYTAAQSPSIVRAIELYHVKGNGWNDIGYNFLVDRFGTVFEGRSAASRKTSSARTQKASIPGRSALRCWANTARLQSRRRRGTRSRRCSRGASISRTSIPRARCRSSPAATRGSRRVCRCSSARSPATATRASRIARGRLSTTS